MKTTFEYLDMDTAIKRLQEIKKLNRKRRITICTIDFDNDIETVKSASPDEGCTLIRNSKTIILNGDQYFPHMELYSIMQDINNIKSVGTMHDIILCGG